MHSVYNVWEVYKLRDTIRKRDLVVKDKQREIESLKSKIKEKNILYEILKRKASKVSVFFYLVGTVAGIFLAYFILIFIIL